MSTILKWAGNKTAIMPELVKHLPIGSRLVEPFAGSCAVMMATDYPHYLVADINPDLIGLYSVIKNGPELLISIGKDLFAKNKTPEDYYDIRREFNHGRDWPADCRAAMFIYLNRHCYRGLCRYNKRGEFNVPYGNYKQPYFPENEIRAFAEKAKRATFICASYDETLAMLQHGDVVYCDPPYDGTFTGYHTAGFTEADQRRLAAILDSCSSKGHPVIASNSDTPLTRSLYKDFLLHHIDAPRSVGISAGETKRAAEIIAVSGRPVIITGYDPGDTGEYAAECVVSFNPSAGVYTLLSARKTQEKKFLKPFINIGMGLAHD
ncbi:DNA adenine methylase [Escherichia coli]|uniref:DNA adenine methylase n=1 Tax=Escherichia coli TaxID=562 RepID=UPI00358DA252